MQSTSPAEQTLDGALGWLGKHLDWFTPTRWNQHFPAQEVPTQTLVELLLLTRVLARRPGHHDLVDAAGTLALEEVRGPAFTTALQQVDRNFGYYAWTLTLLADDVGAEGLAPIRQAVADRGRSLARLDWPTTQVIELGYILDLGGIVHDLPGWAELRGPIPYRDLQPGFMDEPETYAFTHDLLYATDLAGRSLAAAPPGRRRTADVTDALLRRWLDAGHHDLTAELLHCSVAVEGDPELRRCAVAALAAAQRPSGAVPGPPHDPAHAGTLSGEKAVAYEFRTCYHTTLVAAMALAALDDECADG